MTTTSVVLLIGGGIAGTLILQKLLRAGALSSITQSTLNLLKKKSGDRIGGAEVAVDNTPVQEGTPDAKEFPNESSSSKSVDERADRILGKLGK
jgi:hypothetical protein